LRASATQAALSAAVAEEVRDPVSAGAALATTAASKPKTNKTMRRRAGLR
jgi:hypothetical protein